MTAKGDQKVSYFERERDGRKRIFWSLLECRSVRDRNSLETWHFIDRGDAWRIPQRLAHLPRERWDPATGRWVDLD